MIVLYTTLGCHLCDKAKQRVYSVLGYDTRILERDIADDDTLMEHYALKIPVLAWCIDESLEIHKEELPWPFEEEDLVAWFDQVKNEE